MIKKTLAVIHLKFPSEEETRIIHVALEPESETSMRKRSKVKIMRRKREVKLIFEARDTTVLRALVNSYLGWIVSLNDIYKLLNLGNISNKAE